MCVSTAVDALEFLELRYKVSVCVVCGVWVCVGVEVREGVFISASFTGGLAV